MFIAIGISPIVIIAVVIILLSHVVISGAMLVLGLTMLGVSLLATAGIVYMISRRMNGYAPPSVTYREHAERLRDEVYPPSMPEAGPLPRAKSSQPEAIEPREIHNHLHFEGIDPEAVAAYIRSQYGGDFQ